MTKYDKKERIAVLIARSEASSLTSDEECELKEWLAESDANREFYDHVTGPDSLCEYRSIVSRIDFGELAEGTRRGIGRRTARRKVRRIAASAAAVLAAGVFSVLMLNRQGVPEEAVPAAGDARAVLLLPGGQRIELGDGDRETAWEKYAEAISHDAAPGEEQAMIRIEVPRGGEYKLRLADGTQVWLNSETVIAYPETFMGDKRNVEVTGEAFFDVAHDAGMPFEITTQDGLQITVLGTKFNVHSYPDEADVQVTLVEGSVAVCNREERVTLEPNRQAVFTRATQTLAVHRVADASACSAWINGLFDFDSVTLDVIFDAMSRWYNVDMDFGNIDVRSLGMFTIKADRGNRISDVLDVLANITGMKYTIVERTVHLSF